MNVIEFINDGLLMKSIVETLDTDYFTELYKGLGEKLDVTNFNFKIDKNFTIAKLKVKVTSKNKFIDTLEFVKRFKNHLEILLEVEPNVKYLKTDMPIESFQKFNKYNKEDESVDKYQKAVFSVSIFLN